MNKQDTTPAVEAAPHAPPQEATFEVQQGQPEDMQVVEFDRVPLTDINYGF